MRSILDQYWHEMRGQYERLPVWLPGTPMELGDIGVLDTGGWSKVSSLAALGIAFATEPPGAPVAHRYTSKGGAELRAVASASGAVAATAGGAVAATAGGLGGTVTGNAGLELRFSRVGAVVFMAEAVAVHRIANLSDLDDRILAAVAGGRWRDDSWTVVTEVSVGGPSLVAVSASSSGRALVDLGTSVVAGQTGLLGAGLGFGLNYQKDLAASYVTTAATVVLWRGRYVRGALFGRDRLAYRGEPGGQPSGHQHAPEVCEIELPGDVLPGDVLPGDVLPGETLPGAG